MYRPTNVVAAAVVWTAASLLASCRSPSARPLPVSGSGVEVPEAGSRRGPETRRPATVPLAVRESPAAGSGTGSGLDAAFAADPFLPLPDDARRVEPPPEQGGGEARPLASRDAPEDESEASGPVEAAGAGRPASPPEAPGPARDATAEGPSRKDPCAGKAGELARRPLDVLLDGVARRIARPGAAQVAAGSEAREESAPRPAVTPGDATGGAERGLVQAVAAAAEEDGATVETLLLAAAWLGRQGHVAQRDELLDRAWRRRRPPGQPAPLPPAGVDLMLGPPLPERAKDDVPVLEDPEAFRVAVLAPAEAIRGLGDWDARPPGPFRRGATVRLYGEFAGFQESVVTGEGGGARRRRAFRGRIGLLGDDGSVRGGGVFLDGTLEDEQPRERIHFWAEYDLPADLSPGMYHIVIEAEDVEAGERTVAHLPIEVIAGDR